jgi:hypothetical protein
MVAHRRDVRIGRHIVQTTKALHGARNMAQHNVYAYKIKSAQAHEAGQICAVCVRFSFLGARYIKRDSTSVLLLL